MGYTISITTAQNLDSVKKTTWEKTRAAYITCAAAHVGIDFDNYNSRAFATWRMPGASESGSGAFRSELASLRGSKQQWGRARYLPRRVSPPSPRRDPYNPKRDGGIAVCIHAAVQT